MPDIKNINAGQAVIKLLADTKDFQDALQNSQKGLEKFATAAANIGTRLNIVGQYMTAPFKEATRVFAQFDDAMRSVRAVTSANATDFSMLTRQAKNLGATTAFTAQQVAEGMASLGRMGLSSSEISGSIAAMMDLSRATGTDLAMASQIAANNMAVFGINASKSADVADILAATANSSAQTLEDLGEALKTAGPFAKQAGQDLQQTAAALGVMANMGIRGSMAGTALAKTYKQLANPKVQEYLRTMFGIKTTDGNGNLRDTAVVLAEIGRAVSKLGSAQQISVMEKIFDARGALGGGILSMNVKGIDDLLNKFSKLKGYAADASQAMDSGLGGAMRNLASATEGVKIAIGDVTASALIPCIQSLTELASKLKEIIELHPQITTSFAAIGTAVAGIGAALAGLGIAGGAINSIKNGLAVFGIGKAASTAVGATARVTPHLSGGLATKGWMAPGAKPGLGSLMLPGAVVLGMSKLSGLVGSYKGDMDKEEEMFRIRPSHIVELLKDRWIKGAGDERDVIADQLAQLQGQLARNISRDPHGFLVEENDRIIEAIKERSARLAELAEKQKSVTRSTRTLTDWTSKNADAVKALNDIERRRNPQVAEIRELEAERKAYKEALTARINYLVQKGDSKNAEKYQTLKDNADSLYDNYRQVMLRRQYSSMDVIDIDKDLATRDMECGKESYRHRLGSHLDALQGNPSALGQLIQSVRAMVEKTASAYRDAFSSYTSGKSENGAVISENEAGALKKIYEGYDFLQSMVTDIQQRMNSAATGGSISMGAFSATELSRSIGAESTQSRIASATESSRGLLSCMNMDLSRTMRLIEELNSRLFVAGGM